MIYLDRAAIEALADLPVLLDALRAGFADNPPSQPRAFYPLPNAKDSLLLMPSWDAHDRLGVKLVTVAPDRVAHGYPSISGLYVLFDHASGQAVALLDAAALTEVRTATVCALAADYLAPPTPGSLLMIGTGALAAPLIRAHLGVRPIERVTIWGRDPAKAARVARTLDGCLPSVSVATDLDGAVADADIVCAATNARSPLVRGALVRPGGYVSLVGSFTPEMREGDDDLLRRATLVVDAPEALEESGDLIGPRASGLVDEPVEDLSSVVRRAGCGEKPSRDVMLFKTVGTGLADLAIAHVLLRLADSRRMAAKILPVEIG